MSNIEKIRQEIENCIKAFEFNGGIYDSYEAGELSAYKEILDFIDSLPEEKPSEDLEEAAQEYAIPFNDTTYGCEYSYKGFIAGAKWQAKQLLKGSPLPEDTVLFQKGVEEGRRLERDDLALTWQDMVLLRTLFDATDANQSMGALTVQPMTREYYEYLLREFNEQRKK